MKDLLPQIRLKWREAGFQRYFRNVGWFFIGRITTMVISFFTILYVVRNLGPTNFGELDYAIATVSLFSWIGSWGLDDVLNRELIKNPDRRGELTGTAMVLRLAFGSFATVVTVCFALLSPVDSVSQTLIAILALSTILSAPQTLQNEFLSRAQSKFPSLITIAVSVIINLLKTFIIFSGQGVIYLAITMVFEQILYAICHITLYSKKSLIGFSEWRFSHTVAKLMIKTGAAVAFLVLFSMIYARIDQVMIRHFLNAEAVGLYSAGVRLVEVWSFIPTAILGGLYPAVLNARKISNELYYARLRKLITLLVALGGLIALTLVIFGPLIFNILYGTEFQNGITAFQVYALSIPATFAGYFVMQLLYIDDYRKKLIAVSAIPAVLNIILNTFFIPHYGIIGAAWATVFSYLIIPIVPLAFRDTRKLMYNVFICQPKP
jgi:O-antigen/teichoic acid export membrane protein